MLFPTTHELLCPATGATIDASRKVEEWGLIETVQPTLRGRGKRKQWDAEALGTLSRVVAIWNAKFSLVQSAAIVAVGYDFHWRVREPSEISHRGSGAKSELSLFLQSKVSNLGPVDDDLMLRIVNGEFVFEQRTQSAQTRLIARLTEVGVIAPEARRARIVETIGAEPAEKGLPIRFGDVGRDLATKSELQAISITTVNLGLAARVAMRKLYDLVGTSA